MTGEDLRYHLKLFGIDYDDWGVTFGTFSSHTKILTEEYISDACSTTDTSVASDTNKFIFPEHVKKKFHIEGTILGHITIALSTYILIKYTSIVLYDYIGTL